jgi:8-oxo-dGTP pyrophosphatase MutT (NUDIX family)
LKSDRSGDVQYGCLPWRRDDGRLEVMLITSRGTGRWVLPKGWPMIGASGVESAVQEALEEAGVRGEASGAIGRYPYDKVLKDGSVRRLEVEVYPLAVSEELADWKERGERVRRWFAPAEAAALVNEYELAELIAAFAP